MSPILQSRFAVAGGCLLLVALGWLWIEGPAKRAPTIQEALEARGPEVVRELTKEVLRQRQDRIALERELEEQGLDGLARRARGDESVGSEGATERAATAPARLDADALRLVAFPCSVSLSTVLASRSLNPRGVEQVSQAAEERLRAIRETFCRSITNLRNRAGRLMNQELRQMYEAGALQAWDPFEDRTHVGDAVRACVERFRAEGLAEAEARQRALSEMGRDQLGFPVVTFAGFGRMDYVPIEFLDAGRRAREDRRKTEELFVLTLAGWCVAEGLLRVEEVDPVVEWLRGRV